MGRDQVRVAERNHHRFVLRRRRRLVFVRGVGDPRRGGCHAGAFDGRPEDRVVFVPRHFLLLRLPPHHFVLPADIFPISQGSIAVVERRLRLARDSKSNVGRSNVRAPR